MNAFPIMAMKPGNPVTIKQGVNTWTGTVLQWVNNPQHGGFAVHVQLTATVNHWFYASNSTFWH